MHTWPVLLLLACLAPLSSGANLTRESLEGAMGQAQVQGRYLYVAFLGEGWSLSSKRFKEAVLDSDNFKTFAEHSLIYFPVEARRKPPLTKEETAVLQSLVIHFDVKSYPTLILIAPDGQELLRHGFREIEAASYVELLRSVLPGPAD